jgi:hypothetical protein
MTATAPSFWGDDTLYCEATCQPEDVYYEGSDDEDYESPEVRRLRYEAAARRFLDGETPLIMSATLQGPFEEKSGWTNPWRSKYRTKDRPATSKKSLSATKPSRRSLTHTIPETQQPESQPAETQDSLECHLPSPESIKNAITDSHPFLEKDAVALVQNWRNEICPPDEDEFWAPDKCAPDTSLSTHKPAPVKRKRDKGSDWLKRKPIKKSRTVSSESLAKETPCKRAQESSRQLTGSSITTSVSKHPIKDSETGALHDKDELAHQPQHPRRSSRKSIPTAKCQSHRKDTHRAGCQDETGSVDELGPDSLANIKAAATLSSPVSLKNSGNMNTANPNECGNNPSQPAAKSYHHSHNDVEHPPRFNEVDDAAIPMEDLEMKDVCNTKQNEFEAQRDESFIYRLRSRDNPSKEHDTRSSDASPSSSRRLSTHSSSASALSSIEDSSNILCPEVGATQFECLKDDAHESSVGFNGTIAENDFDPSSAHAEDHALQSEKQMIPSEASAEMVHSDQRNGHETDHDTSLSDPARSTQAADGATLPTSPLVKEPHQSESLPLGFGLTQSYFSNQTGQTCPQETHSSALPTSSGFSLGGMLRRLVPSSPWSRLSRSVSFDAAQECTDRVLEPTEDMDKKAVGKVGEDQDAIAAGGDESPSTDIRENAATIASNSWRITVDGDMADASSESSYQSAAGGQDQGQSGLDAAVNSLQSPWSKSQATQALSAAILKGIISCNETVISEDSSVTQYGIVTDHQDQLDAETLDPSPSMYEKTELAPKSVDIGSTALGTMRTYATVQPTIGATSAELPRPSTPEPQLPFKPFSAFMTPSPEHRARRKQRLQGASASRPGSSQRMLASAMKKPWSASKSARRVSWAPLPGSDMTEGGGQDATYKAEPAAGDTTFVRPASPPPIAPVEELPISDGIEFHGHFSAVVRRAAVEQLRSNGVVGSQESAPSPVAHAMADMFVGADELGRSSGPSGAKVGTIISEHVQLGEPDFRDMTDEVFRDIEELLQPYNLEMEMEQAGLETGTVADLTAFT